MLRSLKTRLYFIFTLVFIVTIISIVLIIRTNIENNMRKEFINDVNRHLDKLLNTPENEYGNVPQYEYKVIDNTDQSIIYESNNFKRYITYIEDIDLNKPSKSHTVIGDIHFAVYNGNNKTLILAAENLNDLARKTDNLTLPIIITSISIFSLGFIILYIFTSRTVTDIKNIQKEVDKLTDNNFEKEIYIKSNKELEGLTNTINNMSKLIRDNENKKTQFYQNVTHDLKTPISVIRSYNDANIDKIGDTNENNKIINKQVLKLQNKVEKLLYISKLVYVDDNDEVQTEMHNLIEQVIQNYKFQTDVSLVLKLQETIFRGNSESWEVLLENILDNAIRYANTNITISLTNNTLIIYNDGDNIDESIVDTIFQPYIKGIEGKFGLGLSIVKQICDNYNYSICIENVDNGVNFIISKKN